SVRGETRQKNCVSPARPGRTVPERTISMNDHPPSDAATTSPAPVGEQTPPTGPPAAPAPRRGPWRILVAVGIAVALVGAGIAGAILVGGRHTVGQGASPSTASLPPILPPT